MKAYDSYKDSGVVWIGEIPSHWKQIPLRYLFQFKKGANAQKLTKTHIEENKGEYPVYSGQTENEGILGFVNEYEFDYEFPLIFTTTVGAKFMSTKLLEGKLSLSQNCLVMIKKSACIPSFFQFLLSYDFHFRKAVIPKIIQPSLRMEDLDRITLPYPPLSEQQQIVSFLDTKSSLIDSLIEKTQRKIKLLKEKRTSLINEVVTKGLNPNVEMKDSGVEWIGTMPNNWVKKKVSWISKVASGTTPKSDNKEYYENGTVKWLNTGDLNDGFLSTTKKLITQKAVDDCKLKQYSSYSVVVAMYGATIGKTSVITEPMTVNQACCVINDIKEVSSTWVYYVFLASKSNLIFQGEGGGQPNINQETIRSHFVTIPPLSEQNRILTFLNEQTELIDKSVSIEEERIKLLKEYRQSLISSVVTGKIKVTEDA
jgi:type I restriction enzyme, S subunit